jgi:tryptophan-rich sensory protein
MNPYLVAGGVALAVALVGGLATDVGTWYRELKKPSWNPPDWLFGPAWTLIYALTAWSAARAWLNAPEADRLLLVLAPFAANAGLNAAWSVLFFTVKRPDWALIEVGALWLSIVALIVIVLPIDRQSALLLVPYLVWVSFAATLNAKIVALN